LYGLCKEKTAEGAKAVSQSRAKQARQAQGSNPEGSTSRLSTFESHIPDHRAKSPLRCHPVEGLEQQLPRSSGD
jgi:hypothetical protein